MFKKALKIEKKSTMGLFPIKKVDKDIVVSKAGDTVANLGLIFCLMNKRRV